jgi:kumamolisin
MFKPLAGNIPPAVSGATALETRYDPQARVDIALTLPFRDKAGLDDYTTHLFDPADPLYHHYLTAQEINARFGPTQADYDAVVAFAKSQGLTVTHTSPNRLLLDVSAPAATVETAFGVRLMQFQDKNGRIFHAPDREPSVPAAIAPRLLGIIGMDNDAVAVPQLAHGKTPAFKPSQLHGMTPDLQHPIDPGDPGGGSGGGSTPPAPTASGTAVTAYNLNSIPQNGQGQILDLVELIGFNPNDVTAYENAFGLPHVPIQIISVDGASNTTISVSPSISSAEPTLDIELAAAVAPGLSLIRVYEGPSDGSFKSLLDVEYIIAEGQAYQTSCSYAYPENGLSSSQKQSEGNILQYLLVNGNSFFAASGDWGPYDNNRRNVTALDPASQYYSCAVGGTTLSTDQYGNYASETTWDLIDIFNGQNYSVASGGGVSNFWTIGKQSPVIKAGSGASTTMRNVPDVSLNAYADYAFFYNGGWSSEGGTSAACPIWASFLALVNSRLVPQGVAPLADFTSALYSIAAGPRYTMDFHDIADGSNNHLFSGGPGNQAVPGYDLTTGLGSFNGANLFADLVAAAGGK